MKTEEELKQFYESVLKIQLQPLEELRLSKLGSLKNYLYFALGFASLILISFLSENAFVIFNASIPSLVFLGLSYQTYRIMNSRLRVQFKSKILPELLHFMFEKYEYLAHQRFAGSVLQKSMLFPFNITLVEGEDFMKFWIGETGIMFCETTVCTGKEKVKFMGLFVSATFNKSFKSKTFVLSHKFSSFISNLKRHIIHDVEEVKLEDPEFNKEFKVLSTDQVEARYILTPSFMQRLLEYKRKTKEGISFSFADNRLYCAIPKFVNLFEPALFEPFNYEFIKRNYDPLKLYTGLVDDLHLNLRIWS